MISCLYYGATLVDFRILPVLKGFLDSLLFLMHRKQALWLIVAHDFPKKRLAHCATLRYIATHEIE